MVKETLKHMVKKFGAIEAKTPNYNILNSEMHLFIKQNLYTRNVDFAKVYLEKLKNSYEDWPSVKVYESLKAQTLSIIVELSIFAESIKIDELFYLGANLFTINENIIFEQDIEEMFSFLEIDKKLYMPFILAVIAYSINTLQKLYEYDNLLFEGKVDDLNNIIKKVDDFVNYTYKIL
jgi:hypothetical protein